MVVLHSTGEVFSYTFSGTWFASLLLQTLFHFAVPVFFMLSGATLMNYRQRYSTRQYFQRRWQRIGIPFVFWTIAYVIWTYFTFQTPFSKNLIDWINLFSNNGASNIFWFFYALVPVYLMIPILSLIDWQKHRRILLYILCICFVFNQIIPLLSHFSGIIVTPYASFPLSTGYLDYVLIGCFLQTLRITPKRFGMILIIGLGGSVGMAGGTWLLSSVSNATDAFFMDYHSIFCYGMAIAAFIIARYYYERTNSRLHENPKVMQTLSRASFGVYLIHIIVLTSLQKLIAFPHPILKMTLGALIVYIVSLALTLLIKRIPLIKHIMP